MKALLNILKQAHHDEQGAEAIEKIMILAAIALPLLALLIYFRNDLTSWLSSKAEEVTNDANSYDPNSGIQQP
ncbi:MAG: hypothetical protein WC058_00355 [Phycisphaeraceae bacterium]